MSDLGFKDLGLGFCILESIVTRQPFGQSADIPKCIKHWLCPVKTHFPGHNPRPGRVYYIYTHIHNTYIWICINIYIYTHKFIIYIKFICIYIYTHTLVYKVYIYIHIYIYIYVKMLINIYIYIHNVHTALYHWVTVAVVWLRICHLALQQAGTPTSLPPRLRVLPAGCRVRTWNGSEMVISRWFL